MGGLGGGEVIFGIAKWQYNIMDKDKKLKKTVKNLDSKTGKIGDTKMSLFK